MCTQMHAPDARFYLQLTNLRKHCSHKGKVQRLAIFVDICAPGNTCASGMCNDLVAVELIIVYACINI